MALIHLCFGRLDDVRDTGISAMRHQNSVLHTLVKAIPWPVFNRLAEEHGADRGVRTLTTKGQRLALLYGPLSGAESPREIAMGLMSHQARLPRLGLRLSGLSRDWARFSTAACGAKLHVIYDPDADRPVYAVATTATVNDITPAKAMPIEPGATYVFDLGYYDFGWWATLDAQGCRLVTRLKSNTPLRVVAETKVREGSAILSDRIGHLPARMAAAARTHSRTRCGRSGSGPRPVRCCASSATISTRPLRRSPTSTSGAGRSSCSSAGSSRCSRSSTSSASARTRCAFSSPWP
jgi:hypothetical protein